MTTPPISSGSIGTGAEAPLCRAATHVIEQATRMATTSAVRLPVVMIPLWEFPGGFLLRTQTFAAQRIADYRFQKTVPEVVLTNFYNFSRAATDAIPHH
ncbi:MAG: hypothetical protein DMF95_07995 [Acidobacteria bacterium]|nr:MAG: hypothetical protein DMF96_16790 [Acidobacteriota bacterium]PYR17864.1 MAG: hypothetical protein DMF94_22155 [Acidobacteriota bacterium]PYR51697.1 MAG: hypothetical protein DMF95_07995 [Acidobacteriota bacterium]